MLFILVLNGIKNPVSGAANDYSAEFTDATGLRPNADVRIRGVRVGKVGSVDMKQGDDQRAVAVVHFTLSNDHHLTDTSKAAIKYANLSGVRYLDISAPADGPGAGTRHLATNQTVASFDITELFNGLQPALAVLSPQEINQFTQSLLSLVQGDGGGLEPIMDSIDTLSRYVKSRQQIVSTLVANISKFTSQLGGTSPRVLELLRQLDRPVQSAMGILDEFQKGNRFGPGFTSAADTLLDNLGLQPDTNVDQLFSKAFPQIGDIGTVLNLLPTVFAGLQRPASVARVNEKCSKGPLILPEIGQVLLNGSGVVLCKG